MSEASLEGGQGGQLTPLEFWNIPWKSSIFGLLSPLCIIPSILTPLSEIPNRASAIIAAFLDDERSYRRLWILYMLLLFCFVLFCLQDFQHIC